MEPRAAFGVEIGEYRGIVRVPRRVFQRLLPERPTPQRCVGAYYLQRPRFESIAERKLRRRQLTEDGNVEISGRDLGRVPDEGGARSPGERFNSTLSVVRWIAFRRRIVGANGCPACPLVMLTSL